MTSPYAYEIYRHRKLAKQLFYIGTPLMVIGIAIMLIVTSIFSSIPFAIGGLLNVAVMIVNFKADNLESEESDWRAGNTTPETN